MTVTRDATSGRRLPQSAAEWTELLAGTGIANPSALYLCQEASGNLVDSIGSINLVKGGSPDYQVAIAGESSKGIRPRVNQTDYFASTAAGLPDVASASMMFFAWVKQPVVDTGGIYFNLISFGSPNVLTTELNGNGATSHLVDYANPNQQNGTDSAGGFFDGNVHPLIGQYNHTIDTYVVQNDIETISRACGGVAGGKKLIVGGTFSEVFNASGGIFEMIAVWFGADAELDATARAALIDRLTNGIVSSLVSIAVTPDPASALVGSTAAMVATGTYADTSTADVTSDAAWSVYDPNVATVDSSGVVTGVGEGTTTVVAVLDSIAGVAEVDVAIAEGGCIVGNILGNIEGHILGLRSSVAVVAGLVTGTTKDELETGAASISLVAAIEGYRFLLTDGDPDKTVDAWTHTGRGADWENALGGTFFEIDNQQKADPWEPFQGGGTCKLYVVDEDGTDQFGIDTHRSTGGGEAQLAETLRRDQSEVTIKGGADFGNFLSDAFIGTECVTYTTKTIGSTLLSLSRRGKYAPFQSASSVSRWVDENGDGFDETLVTTYRYEWAQQHRVGFFDYSTQLEPIVSQYARVWAGKWTGVWMHKKGKDGTLNSRDDAQLVFPGKITEIVDDPDTSATVVTLKHVLDVVKDSSVGRDMFKATVAEGLYLSAGMTFYFEDGRTDGSALLIVANLLTVVASGASGHAQINQGYYTLASLTSAINTWLAGETLYGTYSLASPETLHDGSLRTVMHWNIDDSGNHEEYWSMTMPTIVALFLGIVDVPVNVALASGGSIWGGRGPNGGGHAEVATATPFRNIVFAAFGLDVHLGLESFQGGFADQWDWIPASIKATTPANTQGTDAWGIFLLDGKALMVGAVVAANIDAPTELHWCWPLPSTVTGTQNVDILTYSRKADDTSGPIEIRQIAMMEVGFGDFLKMLFYSTGQDSYNDPTYDRLPAGWGIGIPGTLLGQAFENSIDQLPGADATILVMFDAPKTIKDLIGADLTMRGAYPAWRDQHIVFRSWQVPTAAAAIMTLDEDNKGEASGADASHRSTTLLTDAFVRGIVKINYDRDITESGEGAGYQDKFVIEDRVAIDDAGGDAALQTIEACNTYSAFQATGAGVESLVPGFESIFPLFSRAQRTITRSIDMRLFEGLTIGDCVLVTDDFARDPATGERGLSDVPAIVLRHRWSPGGMLPGEDEPTPPAGEVALFMYSSPGAAITADFSLAPAARVDEGAANAGYNAGTHALTCRAHEYTETTESADASFFVDGDKIVIVEIDPVDPAAPLSWQRTISGVSGDVITLSSALSSPAWDAAKLYMITYDHFANCQASQKVKAFQADDVTAQIELASPPFAWLGSSAPPSNPDAGLSGSPSFHTDLPQLGAASAYGDGKPYDVGYMKALARTIENLIDHKTAPSSSALGKPSTCAPAGGKTYQLWGLRVVFMQETMRPVGGLRYCWVAPQFKSADGSPVTVRVTMTMTAPHDDTIDDMTTPHIAFAQKTWTTSSTTYVIGAEQTFSTGMSGVMYLRIEGTAQCTIAGLAQVRVSERT